ncbi:MAG: hypothetical protein EHM34_00015 [Nitrosopumilales archaeon]|nr:MAG: hypothetical protein EHM34_00015 [Nitrosopumilales archaeon]
MERIVLFIPYILIVICALSTVQSITADLLSNSLQQRIGDYDVSINAVPRDPISGQETRINIMITTVSNNPITDTPIAIRISDERDELVRTQPILLSSGHFSYNYSFNNSGIFLLSIDILDNPAVGDSNDSNKKLIFDFPIRVSEPYSAEIANLKFPIIITAAATGSVISLVLLKKFKKSKKVT